MDDVVIPFQVQPCCPAEEYQDFYEMCRTNRGQLIGCALTRTITTIIPGCVPPGHGLQEC